MKKTWHVLALTGILCAMAAPNAAAKPAATKLFCEQYPNSPVCDSGNTQCVMCHTTPPARNPYGTQIESILVPNDARPLSDQIFEANLDNAMRGVESMDADGDGATNLEEINAGTSPSDKRVKPTTDDPCDQYDALGYNVCGYDPVYVYNKLHLDFCGYSPLRKDIEAFKVVEDKQAALHSALDVCLDTEYWMGREGVVWNMANNKINPTAAIKSGEENPGPIPLADYLDDYNFFVYTQIDNNDVRDVLVGDYFVARSVDNNQTMYEPFQRTPTQDYAKRGQGGAQLVARNRRAGMLTHRWFLMVNTMFTAIPRTTAAQAYRAYLGLDISKMQGLDPVPGEPKDYDNKGVKQAECAVCHSTLDPLTYPFSRYEGIGGGTGDFRVPFTYNATRLDYFRGIDGDSVADTPETGVIFGQEVSRLRDWAKVAANSEAFARATVMDYWTLLQGEPPRASEMAQYNALWRDLMGKHEYGVERMLHDLIMTEAYGVP